MLQNFRLLMLLIASAVFTGVVGLAPANAAVINLTPSDCTAAYPCWESNDNSNLSIAEVETLTGLDLGVLAYKDNVGGSEEGPSAGDYTTTFANSPTDPQDATISWDGPGKLAAPVLLEIKDGNQIPAVYYFLISSWDGMMDIVMTGFWPNQGAISHVSLYSVVPVPAAIPLFLSGLATMGFFGWRRKHKAAAA